MDAHLAAAKAEEIEILEERPDGSGVVRIPILAAGQEIDLSKTSGGNKGTWNVTEAVLQEIAANVASYPGPVPCGVTPHQDFGLRAGASPSFLEALRVKGGTLYGDLWLCPGLMYEVKGGYWRGFSGEFALDLALPTKKLKGWCMYGGVFTNRPATDVNFKVAAEADDPPSQKIAVFQALRLQTGEANGRNRMSADLSVRLATVEAESESKSKKIVSLEGRIEELSGFLRSSTEQVDKATKEAEGFRTELQMVKLDVDRKADDLKLAEEKITRLEAERQELKTGLVRAEDANLAINITKTVRAAIRDGAMPAFFEGCDTDPVKWFRSKFVSFEALEQFCTTIPKNAALSAVKSGKKDDADDSASVPPAVALELRRRGLDPRFATVSNSDELIEIKNQK
jgi:hypothetical protein